MFIPVRILNNNFDFRIYRFCRAYNKRLRSFCHQAQPVISPALIPFGIYTQLTLAVCKKEIIKDYLIKVFCCEFNYLSYLFPVFGICIAKCFKPVHFVNGQRNPACCLNASAVEELFCCFDCLFIHNYQVAVCFKIYLIDMNL